MADGPWVDLPADHAVPFAAFLRKLQSPGQIMLKIDEGLSEVLGHRTLLAQGFIQPGDKQCVAQTRMQDGRAGKETVRIPLMDDEKANLVPHSRVAAQHRLFGLAQRLARQKRKPE